MALFSKENLLHLLQHSNETNLVFRYKGDPPFRSSTYHVFIIIARIANDGSLVLVNGTSKIEERKKATRLMGIDVDKTLVYIPSKKYNFFSKETVVDCNSVNVLNHKEIKIDDFEYIQNGHLNEDDFEKIKQAIIASPLVAPYIKNSLKN